MKTINFSATWGDKIYKDRFTTIRWNDYPVKMGDTCEVSLKGNPFAKVVVEQTRFHRACDIPVQMVRNDLGLLPESNTDEQVRDKFWQLLTRFYARKPDWKGWNSIVQVIFLKKIIEPGIDYRQVAIENEVI